DIVGAEFGVPGDGTDGAEAEAEVHADDRRQPALVVGRDGHFADAGNLALRGGLHVPPGIHRKAAQIGIDAVQFLWFFGGKAVGAHEIAAVVLAEEQLHSEGKVVKSRPAAVIGGDTGATAL